MQHPPKTRSNLPSIPEGPQKIFFPIVIPVHYFFDVIMEFLLRDSMIFINLSLANDQNPSTPSMDFSLFNSGFHLYHDIWRDWIHFMGSFCVFCNFCHQLSFSGSRGLKPTVLTKTYKRWHFTHQSVISLCLFMFFEVPVSRITCRIRFSKTFTV